MPSKKVIQKIEKKYASELLKLIPDELHKELIKEFQVDKEIRKLNGQLIFNLIFYTLLSADEISLRKMSHYSSTAPFHALARQACETLAHNSIRQRLIQISSDYFRKLYEHLYQELARHYEPRHLLRQYRIKRFDSSMVHTFAHLIEGMRVGNTSKNKRQVKYTTEMSGEGLLNMHFFSDQAHVGDENTLKEVIEARSPSSQDIVIFDAGLKSRKTFMEFDQKGFRFVTRLNTNPVYEVLGPVPTDFTHGSEHIAATLPECAPVMADQMVTLYAARYKKIDHPFRLIQLDIGEDQPLCILTNITHLPPEVIGAIYRIRWDIEVLFRFLKQELSFSHILCYDRNAIQVMIYMTLITAMLILIYKKQNQIQGYWKAKAEFFNDLIEEVLYMATDDPDTQQLLKERLVKKRPDLIPKSNEHS